MPTILITANYDGYAEREQAGGQTNDYPNEANLKIGFWIGAGGKGLFSDRAYLRFPLSSLPSGATVTQVGLKLYCNSAGGASAVWDVHAYESNGQTDPEGQGAVIKYENCASGNLYYDDGTDLRTTGEKWFTLGGTVCQDVVNAKASVNRFSLGLHEEGENDYPPYVDALEKSGGVPAQLEITYEGAAPPAVGYSYSDGLVCIQVAG